MSPELAARLRELIDRDVERRAGRWPPARVWHVWSVAGLREYYVGERGEVYKLDLGRDTAALDFVDNAASRQHVLVRAVDAEPDVAELLDVPMPARCHPPSISLPGQRLLQRTYRLEKPTPSFYEKYTLHCLESGACRLVADYYRVVEWMFAWDARGRWRRDGDEVQFDLRHVKPPTATPPTRATLLDDMRIEVHDIGVLAAARGDST